MRKILLIAATLVFMKPLLHQLVLHQKARAYLAKGLQQKLIKTAPKLHAYLHQNLGLTVSEF